jgi:hypothetical protein
MRVRAAHEDYRLNEPRPEEWLVIEWPEGEDEPTKYWFSTLDAGYRRSRNLIDTIKLRWRIERDYQELKQELGLGHYEGRGWRGFHHHATLCIAAYGFLISERETIPPSGAAPAAALQKTCHSRRVTDPEALPIRTQRHMPDSIATMRERIGIAIARSLPRCPCCARLNKRGAVPFAVCDTVRLTALLIARGIFTQGSEGAKVGR